MFNWLKKIIPPEEPQNTDGKIVLRIDKYSPYSSGFHVEFSYIKDGVKVGNDTIHMNGDMKNSWNREGLQSRLEKFRGSKETEWYLKDMVGKTIS